MSSRSIIVVAAGVVCVAVFVLLNRSPDSARMASAIATAPALPSTPANVQFPWLERVPAEVAHRNEERAGFAWILRQFGTSDTVLNRIAEGDLNALVTDLDRQWSKGDATAINTLGWFARRCSTLKPPESLESYDAAQEAQAKTLPQADATWLTSLIDADQSWDRALASTCSSQIHPIQIHDMLSDRANRGDARSQWLLSGSADNDRARGDWLRKAAAGGFPEAQYELALRLLGQSQRGPDDPSPGDLLRKVAPRLPDARAKLALCEFQGCAGVTRDPKAAVQDARLAAQSGQPTAILTLTDKLPPSALDPGEGAAWQLFEATLEQLGCRVNDHYVDWLTALEAVVSPTATAPQAQALAAQYWSAYGAQATTALGCTASAHAQATDTSAIQLRLRRASRACSLSSSKLADARRSSPASRPSKAFTLTTA